MSGYRGKRLRSRSLPATIKDTVLLQPGPHVRPQRRRLATRDIPQTVIRIRIDDHRVGIVAPCAKRVDRANGRECRDTLVALTEQPEGRNIQPSEHRQWIESWWSGEAGHTCFDLHDVGELRGSQAVPGKGAVELLHAG
jgi:hypothetical protein